MRRIFPTILLVFLALPLFSALAMAQEDSQTDVTCMVYFTGVGCPHCAVSDPFVLQEMPNETENLVVIEYEIYQQSENSPLLMEYNSEYGTGLGVPLLIIDETYPLMGDRPIIDGVGEVIDEFSMGNNCLLLGGSLSFEEMDLDDLSGFPKIWSKNRVLLRVGKGTETLEVKNLMKELILSDSLCKRIDEEGLNHVSTRTVPLSGKNLEFSQAVELGTNWILQYNEGDQEPCEEPTQSQDYTIFILAFMIIIFSAISIILFLKFRGKGGK